VAAVDYFLKLEGIPGESNDSEHKDEIEVTSFSWGETNSTALLDRAATGKVQMQDLSFAKPVDKASPKLLLACATGQHLKSAVLTARKAGESPQEFLVLTLSDVIVTSYQTGGAAGGANGTLDQVSLAFGRLQMEYRPQRPDGSLDAPITAAWDIKRGRKV
jgi:type VI secretion system secreted protein Hcp